MKKKIILFGLIIILLIISIIILNKTNKNNTNKPKINQNQKINAYMQDKSYDDNYKDQYKNIKYIEKENFVNDVNNLLKKNYKEDEINLIFEKLSKTNIEKLLLLEEKIAIKNYINYKNFDINNFNRYENYKKSNPDLSIDKIITYVNIDLDRDDYTNMNEINNPDDFFVIVNKHNKLPDNYAPKDLVAYNKNNSLRTKVKAEVIEPLNEFFESAKKDGHNLYQTTSYRDYDWQNRLYTNYVKKDGTLEADTYSARPGNSEHQTGYAIDLASEDLRGQNKRLTSEDEQWIKDNCWKYGFILRYTKENEHITRYVAESWHIRYVGLDAAKTIYDEGLTLEEYVDLYIKEY